MLTYTPKGGSESGWRIMHSKTYLVDRIVFVTGSANSTHAAMGCNEENIVVVHSLKVGKAFRRRFQELLGMATCRKVDDEVMKKAKELYEQRVLRKEETQVKRDADRASRSLSRQTTNKKGGVSQRSGSKSRAGAEPADRLVRSGETEELASTETLKSKSKPEEKGDGWNFGCGAVEGRPLLLDSGAAFSMMANSTEPDSEAAAALGGRPGREYLTANCRMGRHRSAHMAQCVLAAMTSGSDALEDAAVD